jgi:hypothetical protein
MSHVLVLTDQHPCFQVLLDKASSGGKLKEITDVLAHVVSQVNSDGKPVMTIDEAEDIKKKLTAHKITTVAELKDLEPQALTGIGILLGDAQHIKKALQADAAAKLRPNKANKANKSKSQGKAASE